MISFADMTVAGWHDTQDFWAQLEALCGALAGQLGADTSLSALARGIYNSAAAAESLAPLAGRVNDLLDRLIADGQRVGAIRNDLPDGLIRDVLKSVAYSIDKWFAVQGASLSPDDLEHASKGAFEMVRNLVARPAPEDNRDA